VNPAPFQMPWAESMFTPPLLVKFGTVHAGGGLFGVTVIVVGAEVVLPHALDATSVTVYVPGFAKTFGAGSWTCTSTICGVGRMTAIARSTTRRTAVVPAWS